MLRVLSLESQFPTIVIGTTDDRRRKFPMSALIMSTQSCRRRILGFTRYAMLEVEHIMTGSTNECDISPLSRTEHMDGCAALAGVDICTCGVAWSPTVE